MSRKCPKCSYIRKETDKVPEYECPNCGIVYAKVEGNNSYKDKNASLNQTEEVKSYKNCQFCGEQVLSVAIKCKHCQSDISNKDKDNNSLISCSNCNKKIAKITSQCPYCGANNPLSASTGKSSGSFGFILLFVFFIFSIGLCSESNNSGGFKTNQELLREHHRNGEFLGYKDGDKWARDIKKLRDASKKLEDR